MRRTEGIWRCSYNQCANAITVCFCYKSTASYSSDGDVIVKCFVVRIANKEETINMSKKKTPPKMKRFEDLKKNSKARCTNLMYVIYKEQAKEGYSDDEAHARVVEILKSMGILLFPENAAQRYDHKKNHFSKRLKRDNVPPNLNKMEAILQQATQTLNTLQASIFDLQHMQDDIQKLSDYYGSKQWRKDLEAEEQGLFPEGLKRGILSEGGIYNLLERNKEIMEALRSYLTEDK